VQITEVSQVSIEINLLTSRFFLIFSHPKAKITVYGYGKPSGIAAPQNNSNPKHFQTSARIIIQ